jgi:neutral ceramidase
VSSRFTSTGRNETTCQAALGYAFAAGATDGHGDFDFTQGSNSTNIFWQFVSSFLAKPTPEQLACQAPKPILLDVGLIEPIEWVPFVLPQQIFQIGQLYIVGVPGEFTTMSGRRLKLTIKQALQNAVRIDEIFFGFNYLLLGKKLEIFFLQ